jgi:hypothetical protein
MVLARHCGNCPTRADDWDEFDPTRIPLRNALQAKHHQQLILQATTKKDKAALSSKFGLRQLARHLDKVASVQPSTIVGGDGLHVLFCNMGSELIDFLIFCVPDNRVDDFEALLKSVRAEAHSCWEVATRDQGSLARAKSVFRCAFFFSL